MMFTRKEIQDGNPLCKGRILSDYFEDLSDTKN